MLTLGFNNGDAFEKERNSNSNIKYIFETVSTGFNTKIPRGIKKDTATLDSMKDFLKQIDERWIPVIEVQLKDRYGIDLKFIKVSDIQLNRGKWCYFYTFRNVKPITVKEFFDIFEQGDLCFQHYPCNVIQIVEEK